MGHIDGLRTGSAAALANSRRQCQDGDSMAPSLCWGAVAEASPHLYSSIGLFRSHRFFAVACAAGATAFELSLGGHIDICRSTMCSTRFGEAIRVYVGECFAGS